MPQLSPEELHRQIDEQVTAALAANRNWNEITSALRVSVQRIKTVKAAMIKAGLPQPAATQQPAVALPPPPQPQAAPAAQRPPQPPPPTAAVQPSYQTPPPSVGALAPPSTAVQVSPNTAAAAPPNTTVPAPGGSMLGLALAAARAPAAQAAASDEWIRSEAFRMFDQRARIVDIAAKLAIPSKAAIKLHDEWADMTARQEQETDKTAKAVGGRPPRAQDPSAESHIIPLTGNG